MTSEELWNTEKQQIEQGISSIEREIELDNLNHKRKQSDLVAYLRHLKNEMVEHAKKKPLKKAR